MTKKNNYATTLFDVLPENWSTAQCQPISDKIRIMLKAKITKI